MRPNPDTHIVPNSPEERMLIQQLSEGSKEAFSSLYRFYGAWLENYLQPLIGDNKTESEEIIQEIFVKIWEKRETLPAVQSFQAYVFRMARNKMVDRHRKRQREKNAHALIAVPEVSETTPEDDVLYLRYKEIAEKAISELPPKRKEVFLLVSKEDLSLQEAADHLGISVSVVKKQYYAAVKFIKEQLVQYGEWMLMFFLVFHGL